MFVFSSVWYHTYFALTILPGPGGIKLLKSGSQVLECLLLRQRQRRSHTIYTTPWWAPRQRWTRTYWSLATRDYTWSLSPWRTLEGVRQSVKGWRYLRWTFRMRVFSVKKEERDGFDSSTHSFTHSLLHSFTHPFIHSDTGSCTPSRIQTPYCSFDDRSAQSLQLYPTLGNFKAALNS